MAPDRSSPCRLDANAVDVGEPEALDRAAVCLDRLWGRIVGSTAGRLTVLLIGLIVLRVGIRSHSDVPSSLRAIEAFPHLPYDVRSNAVLGPTLGAAFGVDSRQAWYGLNAILIVALVGLAMWCLRHRFSTSAQRRMAAIWLSLGSVPAVILQKIGSYDVFPAAGALLVVWAPSVWAAAAGGVLLGATSPEQGIISLAAAAGVALVLDHGAGDRRTAFRDLRDSSLGKRLLAGALAALVTRTTILIAFLALDVEVPSRIDMFGYYLESSLANAAGAGLIGAYAWLGASWAVLGLGWVLGLLTLHRWVTLVAVLVGPAALMTATTNDGTRVFAMVSMPAFLVLLGWVVERHDRSSPRAAAFVQRATAAALVLAPLLPALVSDPSGHSFFRFPWLLPPGIAY